MWNTFSKATFLGVVEELGNTKRQNSDQFNENDWEIKAHIEEKNQVLKKKLSNPSTKNLRKARAQLQRNGKLLVAPKS